MNKAIIFDLDGTLWQVINETTFSANEIAKKYNQNAISVETVCHVFGKNRLDASKLYFPTLEENQALSYTEEIEHFNNNYLLKNGGTLYDNVVDTIKDLSTDFDLYIVSNTAENSYIQAFLFNSGLNELFSGYIASGNVFKNLDSTVAKAEGIKKVILENNIEKAIYVGDTLIDLNSSKLANIPFVWAKYGFGKDLDANYTINNIKELINISKQILN